MIAVGTERHYRHLIDAIQYYEKAGFKWLDVPWAVSKEAILMTRPPHIKSDPMGFVVDYERSDKWVEGRPGVKLYPVASAEQSFLQMQMDAIAKGERMNGSYVTMTPCFRNEPVIDDLHQPYFMKVELISWDKTTREDMDKMIAGARLHFEKRLWIDCERNLEPDPIGVIAYDLVTTHSKIELGSYGIREHAKVGRWLYGTGLAEPRYSIALDREPEPQHVEGFE